MGSVPESCIHATSADAPSLEIEATVDIGQITVRPETTMAPEIVTPTVPTPLVPPVPAVPTITPNVLEEDAA